MKYLVIIFSVFSLFQLALSQDVENEDDFPSSNKESIPATTILRALDYVNNVFNENSFDGGLSVDQQQLLRFIVKNLSNDPGVMSSIEKIKGKLLNMAANLKDKGFDDLLKNSQFINALY